MEIMFNTPRQHKTLTLSGNHSILTSIEKTSKWSLNSLEHQIMYNKLIHLVSAPLKVLTLKMPFLDQK
jgi:Asp/Glu/hydantoin racemase